MFTQCRLINGASAQIAWIPAWAAKRGNRVELLPSGEFWLVCEVYGSIDADHLEHQRKGRRGLESIGVPDR
jgi:hypothetical protein